MIFESSYWKKDILKLSNRLVNKKQPLGWNDREFANLEKDIMMGFYAIRKLAEAQKLSTLILSNKIEGRKIPNNGTTVHLMNNHRYFEFYDFNKAKHEKFDVQFVANQIIHSYIFAPDFFDSESGAILNCIHFNSDKTRNDSLYEININEIINLFVQVGNDYPFHAIYDFDEKKKDYKVRNS